MAEDSISTTLGRTWVTVVTIFCLLFNASVISYLLVLGKADNSLHASAMSWSYTTAAAILVALGFGSLTPLIAALVTKK